MMPRKIGNDAAFESTAGHGRSAESIHALTGLRGIAALWVAAFHALGAIFGAAGVPLIFTRFINEGWIAVDLFFVLSGFIICHVHLQDFQHDVAKPTRRFLELRLARIYPAHLVAALCWVPLIVIAMWRSPESLSGGVANNYNVRTFIFAILLLNGWGFSNSQGWNLPSWSVGSEWAAYLCFPLLAKGLHKITDAATAFYVVLGILAACILLAIVVNDEWKYMLPERYSVIHVVSEFSIGCCANVIYRHLKPVVSLGWLAPFAMLGILVLAMTDHHRLLDALYIALFAALIVGLTDPRLLLSRLLAQPLLIYLGRISYSLYLMHAIVIAVCRQFLALVRPESVSMWLLFAVMYVAMITVAGDLLYRLVEEPARNVLRRKWVAKRA